MSRPFPFQLSSPADSNQGRYGSLWAPLLSKSSWSIRCKPFTSLHLSASSVPKTFIIVRMNGIHIGKGRISRRELLKQIAGAGACVPFAHLSALSEPSALQKQTAESAVPPAKTPFSSADDAFLEELEKANFQYFWGQAHPETGLVQDRCHARSPVTSDLGSIAATGFGLTALCIGEKRGFVSRTEAQSRVLNTLRFLWRKLPTIGDSSTILATLIRAKEYGIQKLLPSTLPSCSAEL